MAFISQKSWRWIPTAGRKKPYGFDATALMASCKASIERMSLGLDWIVEMGTSCEIEEVGKLPYMGF
jgi:hypothetical protein